VSDSLATPGDTGSFDFSDYLGIINAKDGDQRIVIRRFGLNDLW
jgi:hypothetical protein